MPQTTETLPNGLSLLQDDRFFKLGQDSVLLSAFAKIRRRAKVLDLGCGTGALALLCWREDLTVTGLEIQQDALDLFRRSIERNRLENVTALHGDLRHMRTLLPHGSMDYVICNPPYFGRNTGAAAPSAEKRTARQDICCTVEEVAVAASFVLHTGGKAAFVFRPERLWVLLEALSRVRLPQAPAPRPPERARRSERRARRMSQGRQRGGPQRRAAAAGRERGISENLRQNRQFGLKNTCPLQSFHF